MKVSTVLFAIAAVLWVVWGAVHAFAGVVTVTLPVGPAMSGIADAVDPAVLTGIDHHDAVGAIVNQHGWNLGWIGLTTLVSAVWVWRGQLQAVVLAALVGGMADLGYFLFLDLGGFVHFVPGTVMTLISAAAILLSVGGLVLKRSDR